MCSSRIFIFVAPFFHVVIGGNVFASSPASMSVAHKLLKNQDLRATFAFFQFLRKNLLARLIENAIP
jgi:hypothetical protein